MVTSEIGKKKIVAVKKNGSIIIDRIAFHVYITYVIWKIIMSLTWFNLALKVLGKNGYAIIYAIIIFPLC